MSKWTGIVSTTEPYNHLGLIKVRQANKNSEIFEFGISANGTPYNLSGLRVFFCTHFEPYVLIEKEASIVDAKNGIVQFVMDDGCMQKIGKQEAYLEIYKEDELLDTTQNFTYTIQTSIVKQLMDGESYIQRLEDLLKKLNDQMEKSQEEIDKWLEDNRKEIDNLMNEMEQFFADKKIEFSEWFESIRDILESIDPGGILLSEIVAARNSERYGVFKKLDDRLENIETKLNEAHFTIKDREVGVLTTLQDDHFSINHEVVKLGITSDPTEFSALVIAEIDSEEQNTFTIEKVGEINV